MMMMEAQNLTEGQMIDLVPIIESLGLKVSPYDAVNYEYAVVEDVERERAGVVVLHTNQHSLAVPANLMVELVEE